jgi:excisionase family DNA binding protein
LSLEQQIQKAVTDAVHAAIGEALKDLKPKGEETAGLLTTAQAGELLACSAEYIRMLQDRGDLELIFLPGSNHRRVLKSQLLELIEKNKVKRVIKK